MNSDSAEAEVRPSPIYVAPSAIHHLNSCSERGTAAAAAADAADDDGHLPSFPEQSDDGPQGVVSLAAVEAEGNWFALDGAQLEYCQRLEKEGRCRRVRLEPVPVAQLSDETRAKMTETLASIANVDVVPLNSPVMRGGYEHLNVDMTKSNVMSDSMTGAVSDLNDSSGAGDDSSSECGSHYLDWSEDAVDSSDDDRSGDDQYDRKRRTSADGRSGASSDNERLIAAD